MCVKPSSACCSVAVPALFLFVYLNSSSCTHFTGCCWVLEHHNHPESTQHTAFVPCNITTSQRSFSRNNLQNVLTLWWETSHQRVRTFWRLFREKLRFGGCFWSKHYWSTRYPDVNITRCRFKDCFIHKHTVPNVMSVHMPSVDEPIPVPKNQLVRIHVIALA